MNSAHVVGKRIASVRHVTFYSDHYGRQTTRVAAVILEDGTELRTSGIEEKTEIVGHLIAIRPNKKKPS